MKLPFFTLSLSYTVFFLLIIVVLPLTAIIGNVVNLPINQITTTIFNDRTINAFKITINSSLIAAMINAVFGTIVSWCIVKYNFFGKKILEILIDIPFIIPTSIAGIALTSVYSSDSFMGNIFNFFGLEVVYSQLGIVFALIFVGMPFVVRTTEPVLKDLDTELEYAALCLGANRFYIFFKITLPALLPSIITGFTLAFARGLGEYGSVIFIAGNIPGTTEVISLLLHIKLEQYDYIGTSIIATLSLVVSVILLLIIHLIQKYTTKFSYGA